MADYARPDSLVSTEWVADNLNDPKVRLIEVDVDTAAYDTGTCPRRRGLELEARPRDARRARTSPTRPASRSCSPQAGVGTDTTVVVYGDNNNWFAAYALWVLKYYGVENAKLMNGGRKKWIDEGGTIATDVPSHARTSVTVPGPRNEIRALRDEVFDLLEKMPSGKAALVDVRSPKEFSGELLAPENLPQEGSQRGGHIPGAKNIPWGQAVQRGRHLQVRRRAGGALRRPGHDARQGSHRLLPHRRALGAHVVRADAPAGLPQRQATTTAPGRSGARSSAHRSRSSGHRTEDGARPWPRPRSYRTGRSHPHAVVTLYAASGILRLDSWFRHAQ